MPVSFGLTGFRGGISLRRIIGACVLLLAVACQSSPPRELLAEQTRSAGQGVGDFSNKRQLPPGPASVPSGALPVHIGGRVVREAGGTVLFGWPGVYFQARFRGSGVRIRAEGVRERMRVLVDDRERAILKGGEIDFAIEGLNEGPHHIVLEKLNESQQGGGRFIGFFALGGGKPLAPPRYSRQIEFVGDSFVVGYGNRSPGRSCTRDQLQEFTDTQVAFGPLVARRLRADYRIVAFSGIGVVRNAADFMPEYHAPDLYPRLLPWDSNRVEAEDGNWHPELIVISLGINDFSSLDRGMGRFGTTANLHASFVRRYGQFIRLLARRNEQARLVVLSPAWLISPVEEAVAASGANNAEVLRLPQLALNGCDGHPTLDDHRLIANTLLNALKH